MDANKKQRYKEENREKQVRHNQRIKEMEYVFNL